MIGVEYHAICIYSSEIFLFLCVCDLFVFHCELSKVLLCCLHLVRFLGRCDEYVEHQVYGQIWPSSFWHNFGRLSSFER